MPLELYDDGVIVRFLVRRRENVSAFAEAVDDEPEGRISFTLSDDLQTAYRWTRTGSTLVLPKAAEPGAGPPRADTPLIRGDAVFVPAVPEAATRLLVVTVEGLVEISLN